ncbi:hypothetical protein FHT32_003952 [Variovorax sp. SG517]|uniref:phage integrase family protein n=1 Tax=Variovorax sp. SG517 TaxID=2587117 RepID=UPI00159E1DFA|nr:phage integrase family protein [Variovorax sp. SG517]NVM90295.1 hypothetical protein [Variovorax sp. SG517]
MKSTPRIAVQAKGAVTGRPHHPLSAQKTGTPRAWERDAVRSRADAPQAHDSVAIWFDPLLSERLAQAGFGTLRQLAQRINDTGTTWWYPVRGIGVTRAERLVQWLHEQQESTGIRVNPRGLKARASGSCREAASEHAA